MDSSSLIIYIVLTLFYYILVLLPIPDSLKNVLKYLYYLLVIGTQVLMAYIISKNTCGTAQISDVFIWGFVPWIIVFVGFNLILRLFPGWKSPFSNTFGYLVVKMAGVNNIFNSMLKPSIKSDDAGLNKIVEKVFEDNSILINQITPSNFDNVIKKLGKLWDSGSKTFNEDKDRLRYFVGIKDTVSEFIWSLLIGIITVSMSSMGVISSKCVKSTEQIHKEALAYKKTLKEQYDEKNNTVKRQYTIKD